MNNSAEQEARDLMEQCGWEDAQSCSAGEVVFLANKLREMQRLRERIEELEKDRDFWANAARDYKTNYNAVIRTGKRTDGHHIITRDQIDKAWKFANHIDSSKDALQLLREVFGIVRCEGCGGRKRGVLAPGGMDGWITCPACHGEGWRIDNPPKL